MEGHGEKTHGHENFFLKRHNPDSQPCHAGKCQQVEQTPHIDERNISQMQYSCKGNAQRLR